MKKLLNSFKNSNCFFTICFLLFCAFWGSAQNNHPSTQKKSNIHATIGPNIIFILADDLGYGDVSCYNQLSKIPTPNIDSLAKQGMRFTDAHAPSSVCTPTRYAILTGRYAWRAMKQGVLKPWDAPLIAVNRLTVGAMLQQNGYTTGIIGKWHLGINWPTKNGSVAESSNNRLSNVNFSLPIIDGPISRGFNYFFGMDAPNFPPYCFIENDRTIGLPNVIDDGPLAQFIHPGPMLPNWNLTNILPELTTHAVSWIEEKSKTKQPFFLYLALTSPHNPIVPTDDFIGKSKAGRYGDFVCQTDFTVGEVMKAVKRAGIENNTLIIFTSDNGPEILEIKPGAYDRVLKYQHYSMGELRGVKRDTWEGGHRVPFIATWPGKIKPSITSNEIICHVDFMATVAAMTGIKLPENAAEDSYNLLPMLLGEKYVSPIREATVHNSAKGSLAIRQGDWVFIDNASGNDKGPKGEPQWFKDQRAYKDHSFSGELFNLKDDISEHYNYFSERPELVDSLKNLLEQYKANGRSTPGAKQKNDLLVEKSAKKIKSNRL
ncbi:MAG: arylsulfatase [Sediminibacterium sp.]